MDGFVARANLDHYLSLLNGNLTSHNRGTITKLMIEEEDKFSHDLESLEFAENRTAKATDRANHFRKLRDAFIEGADDRARADGILANVEATLVLMEQFCSRLRARANSHRL